jgi:hypothetical protein
VEEAVERAVEAAGGKDVMRFLVAPQASEFAGGMIALSRSRLAAGHRSFES